MDLDLRLIDAEQDEGNQRDAGYAVGFESVGARSDRIAGIIAGAVGNDTRIARVVFFDLEDDLHQIRSNVGDLGKDTAGDTQCRCAQRLANRETDETWSGVTARNEQENAEHDQQFDTDQHHANAHTGLQRNRVKRKRLALKTRECGA